MALCPADWARGLGLGFSAAAALMGAGALASDPGRVEETRLFGRWTPPKMDAVIEMDKCGERLCARLVDHNYRGVADNDFNNPDPALRDRPLIGVAILEDLKRVGEDRWKGGTFYDPRTGKTYRSKIEMIDENRLEISGCVGPGLCKGYIWTRVDG